MATAVVILLLVVLLLLVGGGVVGTRAARTGASSKGGSAARGEETLRFRTITGQDPAAVVSALTSEGYVAHPEVGDSQVVVVGCPDGREAAREEVRRIISGASNVDPATDPPGQVPVRFADE